ncbi:hypothetical protein [Acidovorax sp. SUPP2825]|uniref:hypothetical protein n=1 Tax=Acidovorax sp. SUPP2825 TaxID=2920879 RepID=UPI0023DE41B3|nr:hypothetical protein [Acidovorax sp. SUPP2825]GKS96940.1 DUF6148 family protein [Acidovorax sp. SUPP2825]
MTDVTMVPPSSELDLAKQRLQNYMQAEQRILQSQEYVIGNGGTARRNRRADLEQVQAGIRECRQQIVQLEAAANPRVRRMLQLRPR